MTRLRAPAVGALLGCDGGWPDGGRGVSQDQGSFAGWAGRDGSHRVDVNRYRGDAGLGEGGADRALGLGRVDGGCRGGEKHFDPVWTLTHLPAGRVEQVENLAKHDGVDLNGAAGDGGQVEDVIGGAALDPVQQAERQAAGAPLGWRGGPGRSSRSGSAGSSG